MIIAFFEYGAPRYVLWDNGKEFINDLQRKVQLHFPGPKYVRIRVSFCVCVRVSLCVCVLMSDSHFCVFVSLVCVCVRVLFCIRVPCMDVKLRPAHIWVRCVYIRGFPYGLEHAPPHCEHCSSALCTIPGRGCALEFAYRKRRCQIPNPSAG